MRETLHSNNKSSTDKLQEATRRGLLILTPEREVEIACAKWYIKRSAILINPSATEMDISGYHPRREG